MTTLYEFQEKRRAFIARQLRLKRSAVIGAPDAAEICSWKLAIGKALFTEERNIRWVFVAVSGDPHIHSPGTSLTTEIERVALGRRDRRLIKVFQEVIRRIYAQYGCLEWGELAQALRRYRQGNPQVRYAAEELHAFAAECWRIGVRLGTHAAICEGNRDFKDEEALMLPHNLVVITRDELMPFAKTLQPVPQPQSQLNSDVSVCRVGPFACAHHLPAGESVNSHSRDFFVMVGRADVAFVTKCSCGARWISGEGAFQHFPML